MRIVSPHGPGSVYEAFCSRISRTHLRPTRAPPIQHRRSAAVRRESASPPDVGPRKLHHWRSPAHFVLTRPILVSCSTYVKAGGKMKQPAWLAVLNRSRERAAIAPDGRKGAAGLVWAAERAEPPAARTVSKSSCAWARRAGSAQGTAPSALPGSIAMFGTFSHRPDAPSCRPQRGRPASTGRGDGHLRARARPGRQ
jgi:hypothetical protein